MSELRTGETISLQGGGKVTIKKELGRGGQGIVYQVDYNGKDEALKWYNKAIEVYNKEIADGDMEAIESLAFLYLRGSFGLLDTEKGLELYKELANADG